MQGPIQRKSGRGHAIMQQGSWRLASTVIFGLCLAWVVVVHATYFVTLDGEVPETWIAPLRGTPAIYPAVALLFLQYFLVAFGLFLGAGLVRRWVRSPAQFGL